MLSPRRKASLGFARRLQFGPWTCQNRSTKGAPDGQRGASNQVARFAHRHEAGFGDRNPGFFSAASTQRGERVTRVDEVTWAVHDAADQPLLRFTTNRVMAREAEGLDLLGLDHPCVTEALQAWRGLGAEALGGAVAGMTPALLAWWLVQTHGRKGEQRSLLVPLATSPRGERLPAVERVGADWFRRGAVAPAMTAEERVSLYRAHLEPMLERELRHRRVVPEEGGFTARLVAVIEVVG
jgi:hypothetical protein